MQWMIVKFFLCCESQTWWRTCCLQEGVNWIFILSVDIQFLIKWEARNETVSRSDIFQAVEDFGGIVTWFLQAELVTGGGHDFKVAEAVVECIHGQVLGGCSSEGCNIHEKDDLPLISLKGHIPLLVNVH